MSAEWGISNAVRALTTMVATLIKACWGAVYIVCDVLYDFGANYGARARYKKFIKSVEEGNGFLSWEEVTTRLAEEDSTFITSGMHSKLNRVWWTRLDVLSMYRDEGGMELKPLANWPHLVEGWTDPAFHSWIIGKMEETPETPVFLTDPPSDFPSQRPNRIWAYVKEKWPDANVMTINLSGITPTSDPKAN